MLKNKNSIEFDKIKYILIIIFCFLPQKMDFIFTIPDILMLNSMLEKYRIEKSQNLPQSPNPFPKDGPSASLRTSPTQMLPDETIVVVVSGVTRCIVPCWANVSRSLVRVIFLKYKNR